MTIPEAESIVNAYSRNQSPTESDTFMFTEAMGYLIDTRHDPDDMMHLGGHYYELKRFDLALKYYEMAASYDYDPAYECLGYIWYYGRTGERDYAKAYEYFSRLMAKGDLVATYKIADMYRNGYHVSKDQAHYEQMIEDLYPRVRGLRDVFDPVPEVFTRLARIRVSQSKEDEAIDLYIYAKDFLAQRIRYNAFFGNLNIMKWLIDDLYELIEFDEEEFDFYDMEWLLKTPHKITFYYQSRKHEVESVMEGSECTVCFDGKWFRSRDDFYKDACIGTRRLTAIYDDLYGFKTVE